MSFKNLIDWKKEADEKGIDAVNYIGEKQINKLNQLKQKLKIVNKKFKRQYKKMR